MFEFLLVGCVLFTLFDLSVILMGVVRIEKHLKTISEDLRIISLLKK